MDTPHIAAAARVTPPHRYEQAELTEALLEVWRRHRTFNESRVRALHDSVRVRTRHLAYPRQQYPEMSRFSQRNAAWQKAALPLAEEAISKALAQAGLKPSEVDLLVTTTVTGVATPSLDALLVNRMGFRRDLKRMPLFGLGCVAGVAGTARLRDFLAGAPEATAVLAAVELCSLTIQHDDISVANLIAAGLFGDGGAALVMRGGAVPRRGPKVLASKSVFYPNTEGVMGWEFLDSGFKVVLTADVPEMVTTHLRADVDAFLAEHGFNRGHVRQWVAHTGGPKVLEAMESSLELPQGALARSWASLAEVGNLSSASVLHVLSALLEEGSAKPGELGMMIAMGPGFCSELVLLRW